MRTIPEPRERSGVLKERPETLKDEADDGDEDGGDADGGCCCCWADVSGSNLNNVPHHR